MIKKSAAMKNIFIIDQRAFQVRIIRDYITYSKYFSLANYNSKQKALNAARNWRDLMFSRAGTLKNPNLTFSRLNNKKKLSKCPRGVGRSYFFNKKSGNFFVSYYAHYRVNKKGKNKHFYLGNADLVSKKMERHGLKTAEKFRADYEHSVLNKIKFTPNKTEYREWKDRKIS